MQRPLSPPEEFIEVLARDGEPLVSQWARNVRGRVRTDEDLAEELWHLEVAGGAVARALAGQVQEEWEGFVGDVLVAVTPPPGQRALPLA